MLVRLGGVTHPQQDQRLVGRGVPSGTDSGCSLEPLWLLGRPLSPPRISQSHPGLRQFKDTSRDKEPGVQILA